MLPAAIVLWQRLSPAAAVRAVDPAADALAAEACRATLAASLGRDAHVLQLAGSPELALKLAEDMAAANLQAAAARREGSLAPLFFSTTHHQAVALCFQYPEQQPSYGSLLGSLRFTKLSCWLYAMRLQLAVWRCLSDFRQQHPRYLHLLVIAVAPGQQGRGRGSRLLRHITKLADRQGLPLYLEASNERNRALYQRHGFRDFKTIQAQPGAVPIVAMWRPAAGRAAA